MSMISVQPVLAATGAGEGETERRIKTLAMAGLGRLGLTTAGDTSQSDKPWWQDMLSSWSNVGQQILLNNNPTVAYTTGPQGTTTYYPNSTTAQATQTNALGAASSMLPIALIGGAVLLAVVMMNKR